MHEYEMWLRAQIDAARATVHSLESSLELLLAWRAGNPNAAHATPYRASTNVHGEAGSRRVYPSTTRKRSSKNEAIFQAFEKAGPEGLTQDEVQSVAREHGLNTNPSALRALCWSAKESGRLVSLAPGRYAIAPKNEAAVENLFPGETTAPARPDHNQHREGDAGGGI